MLLVTDQSISPAEAEQQEAATAHRSGGALADLGWVLGYFAVAGAVAGVVWWQVASPAYYTRTSDNAIMLQVELGQRVQGDGWFVVIGLVAALIGGVVLTHWRNRHLLLVVLAGYVASLAGARRWLSRWAGCSATRTSPRSPRATAVGSRFPELAQRDLRRSWWWPGRSGS